MAEVFVYYSNNNCSDIKKDNILWKERENSHE